MIYLFIFVGLFLSVNLLSGNVIILGIISIATFLFLFKRFEKKIYIAYLISFLIGFALSFLTFKTNSDNGTYLSIVIESKENYFIVISKFERLIVYENNNSKELGDIYKITGNISTLVDTTLESEFNFTKFLNNKGVFRELKVKEIETVFKSLIKLKSFRSHFLSLFPEVAVDYIDAFLFSNKNYDNTYIAISNSLNLSNLFSSTGLYLSLFFRIVEYLLFLKLDRKKSRFFALLFLSWYMIFSIERVGIRRILYLKTFSLINDYKLKKKFSYIEIISIVGSSMIIVNHFLAYQYSFYLGMMISISLIFVRSALNQKKQFKFISKTSIFVFLFMLPISISSNHEFHFLSIVMQMILTPMTFLFSLCGLISFYTYPIKPIFSFLATILNGTLKGLNYIDISIPFKDFSSYYVFLYYLILFIAIYFIENRRYKYVKITSVVFMCLFVYKVIPYENLYANSIVFLNVGQGDCCVIRKKNKVIMIDTGGLTYKDVATNATIPYLKKNGIYKVDYVFISHSDNDHCGALSSLRENFNVKNIINTSSPFKITIEGIEFENINKWADSFTDINDKSQVLKFSVANKNILMMGDASKAIENKIMNEYSKKDFKIDVLKTGHHGSNTSNSYEFLNFISPSDAIISVGKNNYYGHPSKDVIDNLNKLKINIKRTDESGSISYFGNRFFKA